MKTSRESPAAALVSIRLALDSSADGVDGGESVWAEPLGDDLFRVQSVPSAIDGVSLGDTVLARDEDGARVAREIARRGGHATYRLRIPAALVNEFHRMYWDGFEKIGCTYEGRQGEPYLVALDVPPETDRRQVQALLEHGRRRGIWTFESGNPAEGD
jgi:hypothetical protein